MYPSLVYRIVALAGSGFTGAVPLQRLLSLVFLPPLTQGEGHF